jgi:hypothetical protein
MMNVSSNAKPFLSGADKQAVLQSVLKALESKFYKPELLGKAWQRAVAEHRMGIETAPTQDAFEQAVSDLLKTLGVSHVAFWHAEGKRASSRAALSATYLSEETPYGMRWIFQDVHEADLPTRQESNLATSCSASTTKRFCHRNIRFSRWVQLQLSISWRTMTPHALSLLS